MGGGRVLHKAIHQHHLWGGKSLLLACFSLPPSQPTISYPRQAHYRSPHPHPKSRETSRILRESLRFKSDVPCCLLEELLATSLTDISCRGSRTIPWRWEAGARAPKMYWDPGGKKMSVFPARVNWLKIITRDFD